MDGERQFYNNEIKNWRLNVKAVENCYDKFSVKLYFTFVNWYINHISYVYALNMYA